MGWANESHKLAHDVAYDDLPFPPKHGGPPEVIADDYEHPRQPWCLGRFGADRPSRTGSWAGLRFRRHRPVLPELVFRPLPLALSRPPAPIGARSRVRRLIEEAPGWAGIPNARSSCAPGDPPPAHPSLTLPTHPRRRGLGSMRDACTGEGAGTPSRRRPVVPVSSNALLDEKSQDRVRECR